MAQTISQIQAEIIAAKNAEPELAALTSTSATAKWRLWTYIIATVIFSLQKLFDALGVEINLLISLLKPHSPKWYAKKCTAFQYGFNLLADSDEFNNNGFTAQQIATSKIVAYAACVEGLSVAYGSFLRIKVAKLVSNDLAPLLPAEKAAFDSYMNRIKDAGVYLVIDSLPADSLKQRWKIYYNPLVLDSNGNNIITGEIEPAKTAIAAYLKNLPFNGEYRPTAHVDFVQQVDGIEDPVLKEASARYGALPFVSVGDNYIPDAGFLRFINANDLVIEYEAKV